MDSTQGDKYGQYDKRLKECLQNHNAYSLQLATLQAKILEIERLRLDNIQEIFNIFFTNIWYKMFSGFKFYFINICLIWIKS